MKKARNIVDEIDTMIFYVPIKTTNLIVVEVILTKFFG